MTHAGLRAIAQAHGYEGVLQISYDDGCSNFFIEAKDVFNNDMLVTMAGEELLKVPGKLMNKKTGRIDIDTTVYRTLEDVRAVICLNDINDKDKINTANQYAY